METKEGRSGDTAVEDIETWMDKAFDMVGGRWSRSNEELQLKTLLSHWIFTPCFH